MADYIKRSDAIDLAREYYTPALREEAVPVRAIKNIPSADVMEVERGRWIKIVGENGVTSACRCSNCGFEDNRYSLFNYCPNCGADMTDMREERNVH